QIISTFVFLLLSPAFIFAQKKSNLYQEFDLEVKADYRFFFKDGLYEGQHLHYPSLAIEPEYFLEWADGQQRIHFAGFARLDRDEQRTHWDIRELYWQWVKNEWELSLGAKKIFWGVTESVHLVDIINQTDFVESFDGEQKLGQPMAHLSYSGKYGTFDFFAMPYFRKRVFPGWEGRLRTPFLINEDAIGFEAEAEEWHPDLAFRWSNSVSIFDMGLSYFYGNGREPVFQADPESGNFDIFYPLNHQIGVDLQAITGAWLWKLESIYRHNSVQNMFALASGVEYTFSNIKDSGIDIGLIGEYLFDNRDELALSGLDNDLFVGSRLAFNDVQSTEFLIGGIFDLNRSSKLFSVEASRRFGESWKLEIETRLFSNIDQEEFLYFLRDDGFIQARLSKFF
ncbi:MAG: hypothetical protein AAF990_18925, partial [Bacteroidota bacterium]